MPAANGARACFAQVGDVIENRDGQVRRVTELHWRMSDYSDHLHYLDAATTVPVGPGRRSRISERTLRAEYWIRGKS